MRQVPVDETAYLIIGNGRLARHLMRYLALLNIPYRQYTRKSPDQFKSYISGISHVLVLISDTEIVNFVTENKPFTKPDTIWIHCSGLVTTELAESAHPLTSFSDHLFDLDFYKTIPFVLEKGRRPFFELFPSMPNPHVTIESSEKEHYHAMCVLSGNFSTILWMEFEKYLSTQLCVPGSTMLPYLKSITQNLEHSSDPLTGPLKRNDQQTISKHLENLGDSPLKNIYTSFVNFYAKNQTS